MCAKSQSPTELRLQETLERLHDANNCARVRDEGLRYVHEASRLLILDGYIRGELAMFLHVQAFPEDNVVNKVGLKLASAETGPQLASFILYLNSLNVALGESGNKQPMFVSVVEIVNGPDGVIPSLARLYCVKHKAVELGAENVYFGLRKIAFYFLDGFPDREFSPIILKGGGEPFNRLEPCIVESALQIVDGIPHDNGDIIKCLSIGEPMFKDFTAKCRVNLNSRSVAAFQLSKARFDILDVCIGPFKL